jgi:hypothetical protein
VKNAAMFHAAENRSSLDARNAVIGSNKFL